MTRELEDVLSKEIKANPAVLSLVEAFTDINEKLSQIMELLFIKASGILETTVEENSKDIAKMDKAIEHMKNIYSNLKGITELWGTKE